MKPKRPDSAKSHHTKRTLDSEPSKQQMTSSKFSQTFSSGVNTFHEKPDEFRQYVAEKDKDPRFKHLKSKLEVIQQKSGKVQEQKPSFKPFERKKDKTSEKTNKKIQQKQQKVEQQLNLSKGFAQKNKSKMNSLRLSNVQQKQQQQKVNEKAKPKLKFDAFKLNIPGQKKQSKKEIKSQAKIEEKPANHTNSRKQEGNQKLTKNGKHQKTQIQKKREQQMKSLQNFVSDMQMRNIAMFPSNYDRMISSNPSSVADLQKINLHDFQAQPTQQDYNLMKYKISQLDKALSGSKQQQSIDLEEILVGDSEQQNQQQLQNQSYLSSLSASDLKKRNAFITEVLAGKISKKELDQLEEMNRSAMRIYKLQDHHKQEEDDVQITQINMVKKQSNRLMERNRIQAAGQLYRDCDYLSQQHKKRLQELINGEIGQSPFQCDQLQTLRRRGIDQGIRMYRDMSNSVEPREVFSDDSLPKDPELRKQAQKKVLRQRIGSINQRLMEVDKMVVSKAKILALIKQFQHTRPSSSYQQLFDANRQKFERQLKMIQQAEGLVASLEHKENLQQILDDIQNQYRLLEKQIRNFQQIDEQELRRREKERLHHKLRELQVVEKQNQNLEDEITKIQKLKDEVIEKLKAYDQLQSVSLPNLICQGYSPHETLEDIDAVITGKWEISQQKPITQ